MEKRSHKAHKAAATGAGPAVAASPLNMEGARTTTQDQDATLERLQLLAGQVSPKANTAAVIVAGGQGLRFGNAAGKQLVELLGKPVLTWCVEAFDAAASVGQIVVVCPEEQTEQFCRMALDPYPFVTPITCAPAGDIRQESAYSGLQAVEETYEIVAVHDGARPLVTQELIEHAINTLMGTIDADGVVVGHPSIDTLKVVKDGAIAGTPDRSLFWNAQTPQVFRAEILRQAHSQAFAEGYVGTDDASLVERLGGKVLLVEGPRDNIKITVPEDKAPAEAALIARIKGARR